MERKNATLKDIATAKTTSEEMLSVATSMLNDMESLLDEREDILSHEDVPFLSALSIMSESLIKASEFTDSACEMVNYLANAPETNERIETEWDNDEYVQIIKNIKFLQKTLCPNGEHTKRGEICRENMTTWIQSMLLLYADLVYWQTFHKKRNVNNGYKK